MVSDSKSDVRKHRGFKSLLVRNFIRGLPPGHHTLIGAVTEWPKVYDWKSYVLKGTEGSNPSRSAKKGGIRQYKQRKPTDPDFLRDVLWSRVTLRL